MLFFCVSKTKLLELMCMQLRPEGELGRRLLQSLVGWIEMDNVLEIMKRTGEGRNSVGGGVGGV